MCTRTKRGLKLESTIMSYIKGGQEHQSDCAAVRNQQFVDDRSRS